MNGIELKKYSDTVEDRKTIEEFLDWANGKEIMLGSYIKPFKDSESERMVPIPVTSIDLLNQYFEINAMELDRERRELLEGARKKQGEDKLKKGFKEYDDKHRILK